MRLEAAEGRQGLEPLKPGIGQKRIGEAIGGSTDLARACVSARHRNSDRRRDRDRKRDRGPDDIAAGRADINAAEMV